MKKPLWQKVTAVAAVVTGLGVRPAAQAEQPVRPKVFEVWGCGTGEPPARVGDATAENERHIDALLAKGADAASEQDVDELTFRLLNTTPPGRLWDLLAGCTAAQRALVAKAFRSGSVRGMPAQPSPWTTCKPRGDASSRATLHKRIEGVDNRVRIDAIEVALSTGRTTTQAERDELTLRDFGRKMEMDREREAKKARAEGRPEPTHEGPANVGWYVADFCGNPELLHELAAALRSGDQKRSQAAFDNLLAAVSRMTDVFEVALIPKPVR